ncbi:hypothetical protein V6N13_110489 [Hibiscus sabdariffa]
MLFAEGIMEDNVGFGIPSLGVVYGDLSTLPLYVYKNTFEEDIQHSEKVALLLYEELIEYKKDGSVGLAPKSNFGSRLKSTLEKQGVLQRFLL